MADAPNEKGRRLTHCAFGLPCFLLVGFDWRFALGIALFALFVNAEVLPHTRLGARWFRPGERYRGGIVAYPATVVLLLLIFHRDPLAVAAGWAAMGFGDPAASWIGRSKPRGPLPWNQGKHLSGTIAFMVAAFVAIGALQLQHRGLEFRHGLEALLLAASGGVLESLPLRIDDNFVVGLGTAALCFFLNGV